MVQSPSWEANWFAASQENPRILWNPKVHYRTHKRPPPVPILGKPNPVHICTSHLLEIHPNIIHPSTPRSPQWSLSLRFPHQDPIRPPLLTRIDIQKFYIIIILNWCVLYGSRNKRKILPYTTLKDWFFITEVESVYSAVRTESLYNADRPRL